MADRAALVTGGSSGIGLAIARALAEDGYGVTISGRRPDKLEGAADELRSAGLEESMLTRRRWATRTRSLRSWLRIGSGLGGSTCW